MDKAKLLYKQLKPKNNKITLFSSAVIGWT